MAVALGYDPERDAAPRIGAIGFGLLAERILELAREKDIPVKKDVDLADLLAHLDPGSEVPPELYKAVAEILAFLYRVSLVEG